jgi:hypothetical protein
MLDLPVRPIRNAAVADELPALEWISGGGLNVSAPRLGRDLGWFSAAPSLPEDLSGGSYARHRNRWTGRS